MKNQSIKEVEKKVEEVYEASVSTVDAELRKNQKHLKRHKFMLGLIASFGLVSLFYGFEKIIDQIPLLYNHPVILLVIGMLALFLTGTLYTRLSDI